MSLFCAFSHKTSLLASSDGLITLYDGEEGRTDTLFLPDYTILAVTYLAENVVHILTSRGVYVLNGTGHDGRLVLALVGKP